MARKINANVTNFNMDKFLQQQLKEERQERIYEQVKLRSRVRKVNRALAALKKEGLYDESVAVENIFNLLESKTVEVGKTKSGYVSLRALKGKTITQQTAIQKAIDQFIKNKTSSVKGMMSLYEERRTELKKMFDDKDFVDSLSFKDIKDIYSVFKSNEYKRSSSKYDSKTFFTLYTQAIDEQFDKNKFIKEMDYYIDSGEDDDLKEDILKIYDKYISKYTNR
jgi:hypothetical protein